MWQAVAESVRLEIGLKLSCSFQPKPKGDLKHPVEMATNRVTGELEYEEFMRVVEGRKLPKRAIFILTDGSIKIEGGYDYEGIANFHTGVAMVSSRSGVGLGKHEFIHLLGFDAHHEDFEVSGFPKEDCVMERKVSTEWLCERDRFALQSFMLGVGERLGRRVLSS
jgi:hypothetical protein